jgi:septin family protein
MVGTAERSTCVGIWAPPYYFNHFRTSRLESRSVIYRGSYTKAKDIVEQSKHIQQLDSENKILKKEREEMLKMHEDSMKALQDSATAEINRLKEELAILKDQKC